MPQKYACAHVSSNETTHILDNNVQYISVVIHLAILIFHVCSNLLHRIPLHIATHAAAASVIEGPTDDMTETLSLHGNSQKF